MQHASLPNLKRHFDFSSLAPWPNSKTSAASYSLCSKGLTGTGEAFFKLWQYPQCHELDLNNALNFVLFGECPASNNNINRVPSACSGRVEARRDVLTIHLRSGDVFSRFDGKNSSARFYHQPPLYFYKQVMAKRAWSRVLVLTSLESDVTRLNPIWTYLVQQYNGSNSKFTFRQSESTDFMSDFTTLRCASHLALSFSTFAVAAIKTSLVSKEYFASDQKGFTCLIEGFKNHKCTIVSLPNYLFGTAFVWTNSETQRAQMLSYSPPSSQAQVQAITTATTTTSGGSRTNNALYNSLKLERETGTCWANQGEWRVVASSPSSYEWRPLNSCAQAAGNASYFYYSQKTKPIACKTLLDLRVEKVIFVGDSLSLQHFEFFVHALTGDSGLRNPSNHSSKQTQACNFPLAIPRHSRVCDGRLGVVFHRNDRLYLDDDERMDCHSGVNGTALVDTNWLFELEHFKTPLVVLNRGAHYEPDEFFLEGWKRALLRVHTLSPRAIVVARTTTPGHFGCEHHNTPLAEPPPSQETQTWPFHWGLLPKQNSLLKSAISPDVLLLDIEHLAAFRADAHVGHIPSRNVTDCLHFSQTKGHDVLRASFNLLISLLHIKLQGRK